MRRLVTWLLVSLGIAALVRKLRRRQEPEWSTPGATTPQPAPPASETPTATEAPAESPVESPVERSAESPAETATEPEGDPAAELREKLARSRAEMPSAEESPEDRRAAVHEQGRSALDEMQPGAETAETANEEQ